MKNKGGFRLRVNGSFNVSFNVGTFRTVNFKVWAQIIIQHEYRYKSIRHYEVYARSRTEEETGVKRVCDVRLATHFPHYFSIL